MSLAYSVHTDPGFYLVKLWQWGVLLGGLLIVIVAAKNRRANGRAARDAREAAPEPVQRRRSGPQGRWGRPPE